MEIDAGRRRVGVRDRKTDARLMSKLGNDESDQITYCSMTA
jgi:hypothetical protein